MQKQDEANLAKILMIKNYIIYRCSLYYPNSLQFRILYNKRAFDNFKKGRELKSFL